MTDGFHVPVFDDRRLLTVSTCPVGEGGQATVWACEVRETQLALAANEVSLVRMLCSGTTEILQPLP